jgi:NADH dehydrogenase
MSYNTLLDTIGRVIGRQKVLKVTAPLALMQLVVPVMERFSFFPITSDQITMLVQGSVCDGSWRKTFTFEPTRFEEGIHRYLSPEPSGT